MTDAKAKFRIEGEDATAAAFRSALGRTEAFSSKASKLLRGAFAVGSLGGLASFVTSTAAVADELAKAAVKAGVTGEAISELAYAGKLAGVELSDLSNALRFMQTNLSKASSGAVENQKTMAALGLQLEELRDLKPDEQFELLADRIASLRDPADRARAATEVFGKAGANLLPLFSEGAEGIRRAREEAEKLGYSFSTKTLQDLEAANDAAEKLRLSFQGLATTLIAIGGPTVSAGLNGINRLLQGAREGKTLIETYREIRAEQERALRGGQIERPAVAAPGFAATDELSRIREAFKKADEEIKRDRDEAAKARLEALRAALDAEYEAIAAANRRFHELRNEMDDSMRDTMRNIETEVEGMTGAIDEEAQKISDRFGLATESMSVYAETAARNAQSAFADFLFAPFEDGIKGMFKSFVDILRRMVAEAAAAKIFEALGFGQSGGGGGGGILDKLLGGLVGGGRNGVGGLRIPGTIPGFANGGSFTVGGDPGIDANLVAFRATRGERVTISKPGMGGGGVVIAPTYNIDARGATSELINALPEILRRRDAQLREDIIEGLRRGRY